MDPPSGTSNQPPAPPSTPRAAPAGSGSSTGSGRVSGGSDGSHWTWWWNLNRERLLDFRALRSARLRARTAGEGLHFTGGSVAAHPALEEARERILEVLLDAARDDDPDIATGAIIALGKAADPRAVPVLVEQATARAVDRTVNESAVLALGLSGLGGSEVRRLLERIAAGKAERTRTRAFAALGLGYLGDPAAVRGLAVLARAKAARRDVPACALLALGLLGDELMTRDLAGRLSGPAKRREPDDRLRAYDAAALRLLGDREALPALIDGLSDRDPDVRRQCILSIGALTGPGDTLALKALLRHLARDRDSQSQAFAAVSLGAIGDPAAADSLLRAYVRGHGITVPYAALGLGLLARNAGDERVHERLVTFLRRELARRGATDVKGALAIALGIAGDRGAAPRLIDLFVDGGDPVLRGHAAVALGLTGEEAAIPHLRKALEGRTNPAVMREAAVGLGLLGDRDAEGILIRVIRTAGTVYVRGNAAVALGRIATPKTARVLCEIVANERQPDLGRAFAAVALGLVMDRREAPALSILPVWFNHRMVVPSVAELMTIL